MPPPHTPRTPHPTPHTLQFFFLKYVDPATYQILGNLKIVTTGLLLRLALRRHLSLIQASRQGREGRWWPAASPVQRSAPSSHIRPQCHAVAGAADSGDLPAHPQLTPGRPSHPVVQWMALLLLMAGAATSQINTDCSKGVVQSVLHAPVMVRS